jgi:aspartate racemase
MPEVRASPSGILVNRELDGSSEVAMILPHHIGILAHSADGAALCMLEVVRESARRMGPHNHPEVTLSMLPMGPVLDAYDAGDMPTVRAHLARSAQRLADAGCGYFVCPDNTAHLALESPGPSLPLPGLHIAQVVARRAKARGHRRVGLLGTKWTMTGPVYPGAFAKVGIEQRTPSPTDQALIDGVIFRELCRGELRDSSRAEFIRIIDELKRVGCDAVALCCTEIPLLVTPEVSPLPTLDSARLLAHAAVDVAVEDAAAPTWRGGAVE